MWLTLWHHEFLSHLNCKEGYGIKLISSLILLIDELTLALIFKVFKIPLQDEVYE